MQEHSGAGKEGTLAGKLQQRRCVQWYTATDLLRGGATSSECSAGTKSFIWRHLFFSMELYMEALSPPHGGTEQAMPRAVTRAAMSARDASM